MTQKIIIDTDIGDDIDDALAIVYAVKTKLEIVGITTVFRHAGRRARMATHLLRMLGRMDIPVFAGLDQPRSAPIISRDNDAYDKEGRFIPCQYESGMDAEVLPDTNAVDFIIDTIRQNPGQISVILIGPQTNMAAAIEQAPDIVDKVKEVIMMGGYFWGELVAEWNMICDPEAADLVLSSGMPVKAIGLDVTMQCKLQDEQLERLQQDTDDTSTLLNRLMTRWYEHYRFKAPVLHDPLTIGCLLGDYVTYAQMPIKVIIGDGGNYGCTTVDPDGTPVQIATTVRHDHFIRDFIATLSS